MRKTLLEAELPAFTAKASYILKNVGAVGAISKYMLERLGKLIKQGNRSTYKDSYDYILCRSSKVW